MKKIGLVFFTMLVSASFGGTYYVDANNGNDLWDGSTDVVPTPEQQLLVPIPGPKKTLAAAVKDRTSGDVVIAMPGVYKEGVSNPEAIGTATTLNRVTVPKGVTLQSRDGRDTTFIVGAKSDAPDATAAGLGTNATRCVSASGTVRGFTITGGCTFTGSIYGGGINGGTIIDCVVTNNVCSGRGGGINGGTSVNCIFRKNSAATGSNANSGTFYNCYFGDVQAYQGNYYHCTFDANSYPRQGKTYNSLILGTGSSSNGSAVFWNCYHKKTPTSDCALTNCTIFANAAEIGVDANGRPLSAASVILDKGDQTYFNKNWVAD